MKNASSEVSVEVVLVKLEFIHRFLKFVILLIDTKYIHLFIDNLINKFTFLITFLNSSMSSTWYIFQLGFIGSSIFHCSLEIVIFSISAHPSSRVRDMKHPPAFRSRIDFWSIVNPMIKDLKYDMFNITMVRAKV